MSSKTNLMDLTRGELGEYFLKLGEKEYRATQIIKWMHQRGVSDISKMTDLSKELRDRYSLSPRFKKYSPNSPLVKSIRFVFEDMSLV